MRVVLLVLASLLFAGVFLLTPPFVADGKRSARASAAEREAVARNHRTWALGACAAVVALVAAWDAWRQGQRRDH